MADTISVMISSRNSTTVSLGDESRRLSDFRMQVKAALEADEFCGRQVVEVWINEAGLPGEGDEDSWGHCMTRVREADLVIALYTGEAGWAAGPREVGICHAEMQAALEDAPAKLRVVNLGVRPPESERDERFQAYVTGMSPFWATANTWAEAERIVRETVADGVVKLVKLGSRSARKGKYHFGNALDWSRLDFAQRKQAIESVMLDALSRGTSIDVNTRIARIDVGGSLVGIQCHGVPGAMSVPAARELVGQPQNDDHILVSYLADAIGPIHLIGCQKGVTERQASTMLGTPDATLVTPPFGVYAADEVQKVQLVFLRDCRDETSTRTAVQRFLEWIHQTGEDEFLRQRAAARKRISSAVAAEQRFEEEE